MISLASIGGWLINNPIGRAAIFATMFLTFLLVRDRVKFKKGFRAAQSEMRKLDQENANEIRDRVDLGRARGGVHPYTESGYRD